MPNMKETIGQRLKRLRQAAGLSQRALEQRTGRAVTNAAICQIETGWIKNPTVRVILALAKALDCDPAVLAGFPVFQKT
jgi:transcriptional regulator with XRE-family HTH domain